MTPIVFVQEEEPHHEQGEGLLEGEGLDQRQREEQLFAQEYLLRVRLQHSVSPVHHLLFCGV